LVVILHQKETMEDLQVVVRLVAVVLVVLDKMEQVGNQEVRVMAV
jgi:hypothetical protein